MTTLAPEEQKIIPHLWFDREAREAAAFYASVFPHSKVGSVVTLHDTPSGDCDVVTFELWNQKFMAISAGPLFKFNPAISFTVNFDARRFGDGPEAKKKALAQLNDAWDKLSAGGKVLMPIDSYFFSERYGWVQDKFGLSWQLILSKTEQEQRPSITPSLMFAGKNAGHAEDAIKFYVETFKNSRRGNSHRYAANQAPDREGTLMYGDFVLENQWFAAMDSARDQNFEFNESVSLLIECASQEEIDSYANKLVAVPGSEQCGWLKDKFGVSWQVSWKEMGPLMTTGTPQQVARVTQALMPMKRIDVEKLKRAFAGA